VSWNAPAPLACVDCHATTSLPAQHPSVAANASRADCLGCHNVSNHMNGVVVAAGHVAAWSDTTSAGFHAFEANKGLAACQGCHGASLDGMAGSGSACGRCHDAALPPGVASWKANCTMCHGGTGSQTGAPPKALWGFAGDPARGGGTADAVRTGAHAKHLATSSISPAIACSACHVVPASALSAGHVETTSGIPTAGVTFGGAATAGGASPTWTRASATCSSVYCHGATTHGGTNTSPVWTAGASQAACGTCHGLPPPSPHPSASGLASCATCHPQTMDALGNVIAPASGGAHLNGVVDVSGGGHGAGWLDPTSTGFHAYSANANVASCQGCHGANLDGVGGSATTSCASCHGGTWKTNCTMCHGGTANATGAPPKATWGQSGDLVRVGAHTAHVTASATAPAFDCAVCHVKPASALSAGHMDGPTATVTFGGLATLSGAAPAWNRATATCGTTYCHGGYSGVYNYTTRDGNGDPVPASVAYSGNMENPAWTAGPPGCTSCHRGGAPVGVWHTGLHSAGNNCDLCHPDANAAGTAITNASLHVNGTVDVTPKWKTSCFNCH
jgi:predicted CxxxxCH...CXXCH cytochrome family protein